MTRDTWSLPALALGLVWASLPCAAWAEEAEGAEAGAEAAALLAAIEMPLQAEQLRAAGVSEPELRPALQAGFGAPPRSTAEKGGPSGQSCHIDDFGTKVSGMVAEGLKGKDLADAIHAAHQEACGHGGPPDDKGGGKPDDKGGGPPDDKGGGPPDDKGGGPPDGKGGGPPADKGGAADAGAGKSKGKSGSGGKAGKGGGK